MRLLLWGIIVFVVVMWLLHIKRSAIQKGGSSRANLRSASGTPEEMVQCAQCGIHLPASEAIFIQPDIAFCSEEHRLKHCSS